MKSAAQRCGWPLNLEAGGGYAQKRSAARYDTRVVFFWTASQPGGRRRLRSKRSAHIGIICNFLICIFERVYKYTTGINAVWYGSDLLLALVALTDC